MDKRVTVEMTVEQYQDYLLLQIARAAEEARHLERELHAVNARWQEAIRLAKANGCSDAQIAANVPGTAAERQPHLDAASRIDASQDAHVPKEDDIGLLDMSAVWAPVGPTTELERSALKVNMHDVFFQPRDITVKGGDALVIANLGTHAHTFSIEETDIAVDVGPGQSSVVTLSGLLPSTYTFTCPHHRSEGMEGTITLT